MSLVLVPLPREAVVEELSFFDRLRQILTQTGNDPNNRYYVIGFVVVVVLGLLAAIRVLKGWLFRTATGPAQERGVKEEDLASYPPPPPAGVKTLTLEGRPVRVRLVVVAPISKEMPVDISEVENLLDQLVYGLGSVIRHDKPRICIWPAQLSSKGFSFTFNRMLHKPERPGQPSRWILVAGQTPPRPRPVMLGLALLADEPNSVGHVTVEPKQWPSVLRI